MYYRIVLANSIRKTLTTSIVQAKITFEDTANRQIDTQNAWIFIVSGCIKYYSYEVYIIIAHITYGYGVCGTNKHARTSIRMFYDTDNVRGVRLQNILFREVILRYSDSMYCLIEAIPQSAIRIWCWAVSVAYQTMKFYKHKHPWFISHQQLLKFYMAVFIGHSVCAMERAMVSDDVVCFYKVE